MASVEYSRSISLGCGFPGPRRCDAEEGPYLLDAPQSSQKICGKSVTRCEAQGWDSTRPHELGGHEEQPLPEARQRGPLQMNWNTESLEPIQQVVGQQDDLEEGLVGPEILCRDLAQGVGVFQFSNDQIPLGLAGCRSATDATASASGWSPRAT